MLGAPPRRGDGGWGNVGPAARAAAGAPVGPPGPGWARPPGRQPGPPGPPPGPPPPFLGGGGPGGPGAGQGGRPGGRSGRRLRRLLLWTVAVLMVGPLLAFAIGWLVFDPLARADLVAPQIATVSYADGSELAKILPQGYENRQNVSLSQIPKSVQYAVMSAEDRSYLSNPGFDVLGIARAVWNQLTGTGGGGSTITQQYVKITTRQDQISLFRKYKELVLAAKISKDFSKDQILENYLNTIYLGRGVYGIQAAAQAYFGVNSDKLTPSQGALLAGIIQSPSRWDPAKNPAMAVERWNFVLDGMVAQKWMTPTERATMRFPSWLPPKPVVGGIPADSRGHLYTQIKAELESRGINEQELNQAGLKITTTIDPTMQKLAIDAANRVMKGQPSNLRTALVAIDPRTGGILAYYGGDNGVGLDYAQVLKQPGSAFKPFVMAAALEQSPPIGLGEKFDGSSPQKIAGQTINNSEGVSCENCSLKKAMTDSINTVFYKLAVDVGPARVAQVASQAGIPEDLLSNPTAGIALGDKEVHPGDMASAFATFAADGEYHKPHMITKVETSDGNVLIDEGVSPGDSRMTAQVARNVSESMIDVARSSRITLSDGRAVAVKTGTVQSRIEGQNNDAWTVGYTPSISTAVWVGTDDNSPIKTSTGSPIYGRMLPGSIWQQFMSSALRGKPKESFSKFVPLGHPPDNYYVSASDESGSYSGSKRRRSRRDDDFDSSVDPCDYLRCDDNGNVVRSRRGRSGGDNNDSYGYGNNGDN
ncbi:MAG: penicillin-binding protein [Pseudonocardia sp.]|nr:penicillin-binding protein [Pseudonocardia sp.]